MTDDKQSPRISPVLLALALVSSCAPHSEPAPASVEALVPAQTRVGLDLPPGLALALDGVEQGITPLEPFVITPGPHALMVEGPCGKASASVEVAAGALTTVRAGDFAGLGVAQLTVTAKQLDGTPLSPSLSLAGWALPVSPGVPVQVSACTVRVALASEGLGGFIEDIELEAGKSYVRDVVLAPGPDMVRIHGGHLRMGPPGPNLYDPNFKGVGPGEDFAGWPWIQLHEVDVKTFELDRTEITADQFYACYQAGYCTRQVLLAGSTIGPYKSAECNSQVYHRKREPLSGFGSHAANCIAPWEAEKYCQWVGKRLATDAEWEFAARSRKSEYTCSWGVDVDRIGCDRSRNRWEKRVPKVCVYTLDNTEQGVCDMMTGVAELVTYAAVPGRPGQTDCPYNAVIRGASFSETHIRPFEDRGCPGMRQDAETGFRCARDVASAADQG